MREKIVLFGDSITEESYGDKGWGASLANAYTRKADVLNRGYDGYNTRWALYLLKHHFPLDTPKQPLAATVFFGANDSALSERAYEKLHVPIEEYRQNLRKIVLHLKTCSPSMLIVLITPPPISEEARLAHLRSLYGENAPELPERTYEVIGQYAKACVEIAKEMGLPYINLWSKLQETDGWQKKFLRDGLHLTPEGNAAVFQEVIKVFDEEGLCADKMPYDFPVYSEVDDKNPQSSLSIPLE